MVMPHIPEVEKGVIRYLKKFPVNPDETGITAMLDVDEKEQLFIVVVAINDHCHIIREVERVRFIDFIETLLKK
jgi:hypothetical protein